jgi:hypothetical protein
MLSNDSRNWSAGIRLGLLVFLTPVVAAGEVAAGKEEVLGGGPNSRAKNIAKAAVTIVGGMRLCAMDKFDAGEKFTGQDCQSFKRSNSNFEII